MRTKNDSEIDFLSRERHKSVPRLRLKCSKRTSKRQVLSSIVPGKLKGGPNWHIKRGNPLRFFNIHFYNVGIIFKKLKGLNKNFLKKQK